MFKIIRSLVLLQYLDLLINSLSAHFNSLMSHEDLDYQALLMLVSFLTCQRIEAAKEFVELWDETHFTELIIVKDPGKEQAV